MSDLLSEFLQQFITADRLRRFDEVLSQRTRQITVVLENIYHAHNASACLRTCDCFGIQDVHVIEAGNCFRPNGDIAMGASKWLTTHRYVPSAQNPSPAGSADASDPEVTVACLQNLRDQGYRLLATSPRQQSTPLDRINTTSRTAVIFGAEKSGISDTAVSMADELICIPMYGFTESFNVSVSVAIILHQLVSQLRAGSGDWQLTNEEQQLIRKDWIRRTLGHRLQPLCRRFEAEQSETDS
ncbi:MAG: RNA methyltransferase [Fuerstiella sp.]